LQSGSLELPFIAAGTRSKVSLPKKIFELRRLPETWLTVTFRQTDDRPWAKAGHVIAWSQAQLYHEKPGHKAMSLARQQQPSALVPTERSLVLTKTPLEYRVSNAAFVIAFDTFRGHIVSWTCNGIPLLHSTSDTNPLLTLDFWRPLTNNDERWQTGEWKRYGLDMMTSRLISFNFISDSVHELGDGRARQGISFQALHVFAPPILSWSFSVKTVYTVIADWGASVPFVLRIHTELVPRGNHPPTLPRVGHNIQLSPAYNNVSWFGRGPGESYNDKCSSQQVGIWEKGIDDMGTSYEVPQENGNRVGTRWCTVSSQVPEDAQLPSQPGFGKGKGKDKDIFHDQVKPRPKPTIPALRATFPQKQQPAPDGRREDHDDRHFQFSTQRYDASTIEKAAHPCDLAEDGARREGALWRVDADVAGVGTAACGPGVYERDEVKCVERQWTMQLDVILPSDT
jgi:beta-galactosidase